MKDPHPSKAIPFHYERAWDALAALRKLLRALQMTEGHCLQWDQSQCLQREARANGTEGGDGEHRAAGRRRIDNGRARSVRMVFALA